MATRKKEIKKERKKGIGLPVEIEGNQNKEPAADFLIGKFRPNASAPPPGGILQKRSLQKPRPASVSFTISDMELSTVLERNLGTYFTHAPFQTQQDRELLND